MARASKHVRGLVHRTRTTVNKLFGQRYGRKKVSRAKRAAAAKRYRSKIPGISTFSSGKHYEVTIRKTHGIPHNRLVWAGHRKK